MAHWRAGGTQPPPPAATISEVDAVGDWRGIWAARGQRIAAAPLAPAVAGALLGVLAVAGTLTRAAGTAAAPGPTRLALVLAALATTVPLGLLWARPALAAPAVTAAAVVSLAAFHTLTVPGLAAQLAALYRLGRHGPAGAQRGRRAQRRPAGHRRQPAGAHRPRGAGTHRPGAARRGGPP